LVFKNIKICVTLSQQSPLKNKWRSLVFENIEICVTLSQQSPLKHKWRSLVFENIEICVTLSQQSPLKHKWRSLVFENIHSDRCNLVTTESANFIPILSALAGRRCLLHRQRDPDDGANVQERPGDHQFGESEVRLDVKPSKYTLFLVFFV
jgi:hypothetical protein